MVFCSCIDLSTNQCERIFATCSNVIGAAADLENTVPACIYCAKMKVRAFNNLTGLNFTDNDIADVLAYFIFFLYLETAAEELLFKNVRGNVNINIIFKPA